MVEGEWLSMMGLMQQNQDRSNTSNNTTRFSPPFSAFLFVHTNATVDGIPLTTCEEKDLLLSAVVGVCVTLKKKEQKKKTVSCN